MKLYSDECHWTFTDDKSTLVPVMARCLLGRVDPDLYRH